MASVLLATAAATPMLAQADHALVAGAWAGCLQVDSTQHRSVAGARICTSFTFDSTAYCGRSTLRYVLPAAWPYGTDARQQDTVRIGYYLARDWISFGGRIDPRAQPGSDSPACGSRYGDDGSSYGSAIIDAGEIRGKWGVTSFVSTGGWIGTLQLRRQATTR
jgi:hypothetical protein